MKNFPSNIEIISQTLTARRYPQDDLFLDTPYFWRLSDLAVLYPDFFDTKSPIKSATAEKLTKIVNGAIPEFKEINPVHILTVKENYNVYSKFNNEIKRIYKGTNQKLSTVACEYLFHNITGKEIEQAYFLSPNKTSDEIASVAKEIQFERIREQLADSSNVLSAIINRAKYADKYSFRAVWSKIWHIMYNIDSTQALRERYGIKSSPIDYMKPKTLIFVNYMLQEIIARFCNRSNFTINEVIDYAARMAQFARARFLQYGTTPEKQLMETNSYYRLTKIRNLRKKFWQEYYPQSLKQR